MKKSICGIVLMVMCPLFVYADTIYSVDMSVEISEDATAEVTEIWDVKADSGSEWYKQIGNLGNSEVSNYHVLIDGEDMVYKTWDINESIVEKKGYYGINYSDDVIELCFGKGDYERHTYTLTYTISNFVFNTNDSQVLAWVLYPRSIVSNFTAVISSYYDFSDDLDVWGYGYTGYAYVNDGKIYVIDEDGLDDEYVSLLVKFPLNTYNTSNVDSRYSSFNDVYEVANDDILEDDVDFSYYFDIFLMILCYIVPILVICISIINSNKDKYGYINNKKIKKKNILMYRDIPCNKDIGYANVLIKLNNFGYNETNILGAFILKWVKEDKISFKNDKSGVFNKKTCKIDMTKEVQIDDPNEKKLFSMMYRASGDGILETKEFEKWCRKNYSEFFDVFKRLVNDEIEKLKADGLIYKRKNRRECKRGFVMADKIYDDSCWLYGLRKFLVTFSKMKEKDVLEVKLWDEYLMFAYLFGIADKVAKQLKKLYPEVLTEELDDMGIDYDMLMFVNYVSYRGVQMASNARNIANGYSAGGGGISRSGGGGFSGGFYGGGGSAGGR